MLGPAPLRIVGVDWWARARLGLLAAAGPVALPVEPSLGSWARGSPGALGAG